MANNKVQLSDGTVVIDLTSDTVTSASHIKSGLIGHLADGTTVTGTLIEKDVKSVTYNLSGGSTASISTSEVVTGQGFSVKLTAPTGYALSGVTVTMGGTDITSQVFTPDAEGGGGGGTPAISVADTTDSHGGTVRTITALDISDTTAVASDVAQGKYFYAAQGVKTAGTGSGGSSGQSETGTFTGDNGITVQIPCSFEPDLIRVYGDLSGDVANRGITSLAIGKDDFMAVFSDTSTSGTSESMAYGVSHGMVGYNDTSKPHASYSDGVLTIDMVTNTSSYRFTSGVSYTYKLSTLP